VHPVAAQALTGAPCQDSGVTEQRFDLVVRKGMIVTPGHREQADVVAGPVARSISRIAGRPADIRERRLSKTVALSGRRLTA
jgi:hypothetical protein